MRRSADSQYQQIVELVKQAQEERAPTVRLADRFAIPFTAVSLVIAGAAWGIGRSHPLRGGARACDAVSAADRRAGGVPRGLSRAAKAGVIVEGGAVIEQLARIRSATFDKTGTLTAGRPDLVAIEPAEGIDPDELLALAASAEKYSSHVLADGIRRAASGRGIPLRTASQAQEVATNGVTAVIDGRTVVVGKPAYVASLAPDTVRRSIESGEAAAYVAIDGRFAGVLVLADDPRPESRAVVAWLRERGVERIACSPEIREGPRMPSPARSGSPMCTPSWCPPRRCISRGSQPATGADGRRRRQRRAGARGRGRRCRHGRQGLHRGRRGCRRRGAERTRCRRRRSGVDRRHTLRVAYTAISIGIALTSA